MVTKLVCEVKYFIDSKGIGYVIPIGWKSDIFVHYTTIEMNGFKTLEQGDIVIIEYDSEQNKSNRPTANKVYPTKLNTMKLSLYGNEIPMEILK